MKVKLLAAIAVFVVGLGVSLAVYSPASSGSGMATTNKGKKPPKVGQNCRPKVSLILRGPLDTVGSDSFKMDVTGTNTAARSFKGKNVTVLVNDKTKILRLGKRVKLDKLVQGDRLSVQARACKAESGKTVPLAVRVTAVAAKTKPPTTTTTETTTST
jgi:hypothetical protein